MKRDEKYYPILSLHRIRIREKLYYCAAVRCDMMAMIGDQLEDNKGNRFTVKSIEMIRYKEDIEPEYLEIRSLILEGKTDQVGECLRIVDSPV